MNAQGNLAQALSDLKEAEVKALVAQMIEDKTPAVEIVDQCREGMGELGKRFEIGKAFIPELILAGRIMENVMEELKPLLKDDSGLESKSGCIVMGTVQNDIHNIGKDIVVMMLRGSGFEVVDLGVNVPPEKFVQAIQDNNPILVGMSVLLTSCYKSITATVEAIKQAGLREKVSIMLGGAAASARLSEMTGCDCYGATSVDAVNYASQLAR